MEDVHVVSELVEVSEKSTIIFTVYVCREWRVTVPKELRNAYEIFESDLVECKIKKIK